MTLVQCEQVVHRYRATDDAEGPALTVLDGVDFVLENGASAAIVGPSGSGKSTLLHLIGALERPSGGTIRIDGQLIGGMDDDALAELRSRRIGFVFQFHHLLPQLSVLENVLVPAIPLGAGWVREAGARGAYLLERVGLGERLKHRPGQLSGGERQRVAVVRALINQPGLVLADEPTGALDEAHAMNLVDLLVQLNGDESVGLVMVTHSQSLAARMGRVYRLVSGKLIETPAGATT